MTVSPAAVHTDRWDGDVAEVVFDKPGQQAGLPHVAVPDYHDLVHDAGYLPVRHARRCGGGGGNRAARPDPRTGHCAGHDVDRGLADDFVAIVTLTITCGQRLARTAVSRKYVYTYVYSTAIRTLHCKFVAERDYKFSC